MAVPKRDLTDPLVRIVCDTLHVPDETYDDNHKFAGMACESCGEDWPCSVRVELGITGETIGRFVWDNKDYRILEEDGQPKLILNGEVYDLTISEAGDIEVDSDE